MTKTSTIRALQACTAFFLAFGIAAVAASAQTITLRIVTYNIEADISGYTTARPGLVTPSSGGTVQQGGVLEGIGEENVGSDPAQPIDILALQETTSNAGTVAPIASALNSFYNVPGMYTNSSYQATESGGNAGTGNGPNACIYNTTTVQLVASVPVDPPGGTSKLGSSSGEYREVMRYEFAPAGVTPTPENEFYIYVSHYKSGTGSTIETSRAGEAQIIRTNEADFLPADARVLYVGDYNISTSTEASYQIMLAPSAPNGVVQGQGIDPSNTSGATGVDWTASSLLSLKTESATSLHYRDDFQVMTTNVYYGAPGGLAYVPGTYHVFGNNGTTSYKGSVNSGSDTALTNLQAGAPISASQLYADLVSGSDHLPVVADYTLSLGSPSMAVSPASSFASEGNQGGPFSPSSQIYTLTNSGSAPLNWTATNTAGWLTLSATAGTLAAGATTDVTASVNANANGLAADAYSDTVSFTNTSNGTGNTTRAVSLTINSIMPVALFTGDPTNGMGPLTVTFNDASTGEITDRLWDFGDGATTNTTGTNVTHVYAAGTYGVTLVASGPGGSSTNSQPNYVTVLTPFESWQVSYFHSTTDPAAAPAADPDNDGMSNWAEFLAGTDPTDPASVFRIASVTQQSNDLLITWTMGAGRTNVLQQANSLDGTGGFTDIVTILTAGSVTNYLDLGAATNGTPRYYRVRLGP